jgi:hypothetical protein
MMPTETAAAIDLRHIIAEMISDATKTYCSDLAYIPEEKLHEVPMGAARTPAEFTAECIGFNRMVARIIRDEKVHFPTEEEREAFVRSLDSIAKAQAGIEESSQAIREAIDGMNLSALDSEVNTPWGKPVKAYKLAYYAASHMSYHDGQINYIQSLYGDDKMHWTS